MPEVPIQPVNAEESQEQIQPLINAMQTIDFLETELDTVINHPAQNEGIAVDLNSRLLISEFKCVQLIKANDTLKETVLEKQGSLEEQLEKSQQMRFVNRRMLASSVLERKKNLDLVAASRKATTAYMRNQQVNVESFRVEVSDLTDSLNVKTSELAQSNQHNLDLQSGSNSLQTKLDAVFLQLDGKDRQIGECKNRIESYEERISQMESTFAHTKDDAVNHKKTLCESNHRLAQYEETIPRLKTALEVNDATMNENIEVISQLQAASTEKESIIDDSRLQILLKILESHTEAQIADNFIASLKEQSCEMETSMLLHQVEMKKALANKKITLLENFLASADQDCSKNHDY